MQGKHASKQMMDLNMIWAALIRPKTVTKAKEMRPKTHAHMYANMVQFLRPTKEALNYT